MAISGMKGETVSYTHLCGEDLEFDYSNLVCGCEDDCGDGCDCGCDHDHE